MVALSSCLIHFKGEEGPLTTFTETSLQTFLKCHDLWLTLDDEHKEIAEKTSNIVENIQSIDPPTDCLQTLQYHRKCSSKFTNITLIKRALARVTTKKEATKVESDYSEMESEESPAPVRKLQIMRHTNQYEKSRCFASILQRM